MSEPYTQSYGPRSKRLDVLVSMRKISKMGKILCLRVGDIVYALIGGKPARLTCTRDIKAQQVEGATFDPNAVYGANQKLPAKISFPRNTHSF